MSRRARGPGNGTCICPPVARLAAQCAPSLTSCDPTWRHSGLQASRCVTVAACARQWPLVLRYIAQCTWRLWSCPVFVVVAPHVLRLHVCRTPSRVVAWAYDRVRSCLSAWNRLHELCTPHRPDAANRVPVPPPPLPRQLCAVPVLALGPVVRAPPRLQRWTPLNFRVPRPSPASFAAASPLRLPEPLALPPRPPPC